MQSMTNWQLYISAGLPTVTGLVTIAIALIVNSRLETTRSELVSRIDHISDDMKQFYRTLGQHDEAIDTLKKK